jgi:DNA-binding winged helix-turn-helix (wHTH) protein/TolB-like protein
MPEFSQSDLSRIGDQKALEEHQKRSEASQSAEVYRFGPFALDVSRRKLSRDSETVTLSGKAFDLLAELVAERERVMTRAELLDRVWPGVVVEEANLTQTISVVRKALGDEAGSNEYIATVPGRGYRFVAPVSTSMPDAPVQPVAASRRSLIPIVVALLIALAGAVGWLVGKSSASSANQVGREGRAIAVLPFYEREAGSGAPVAGMDVTELVIGHLTGRKGIRVRAAGDVLEFHNPRSDTPAAAGRQLGVDEVISGAMTVREGRLRVTVQRVRSADGATLQSIVFEEPIEEPGTLASRVAARVIKEIGLEER